MRNAVAIGMIAAGLLALGMVSTQKIDSQFGVARLDRQDAAQCIGALGFLQKCGQWTNCPAAPTCAGANCHRDGNGPCIGSDDGCTWGAGIFKDCLWGGCWCKASGVVRCGFESSEVCDRDALQDCTGTCTSFITTVACKENCI